MILKYAIDKLLYDLELKLVSQVYITGILR